MEIQPKVDYVFDVNRPVEEIGQSIFKMINGTIAEVRNEQTTVFLEKKAPMSYVTPGPTGLISLKVINHAGLFEPHCADVLLDAARTIAKDNSADYQDYSDDHRWFRGIYYRPMEVGDEP